MRTFKIYQAAPSTVCPLSYGSSQLDHTHHCLERVERATGFQKEHSQLPTYPSYTRSNRQLRGTQVLYTILSICTRYMVAWNKYPYSFRNLQASPNHLVTECSH